MTNTNEKEKKTVVLSPVKLTPSQKAKYENALMKLGLSHSKVIRKTVDAFIDNADNFHTSFNWEQFIEKSVNWDTLIEAQQELTIDNPDFDPLEILFMRRSDEKQSSETEQEKIIAMRDNGEVDAIILSAESSSSYKNLSFLLALQFAREIQLPLKIYAKTRSEIEEVTRSADNMKLYVRYAQENLMFDVEINGFNLFNDGSLLIFLAEINESKWLSNANTKLAEKHFRYKQSLKNKNLDNLEPLEKKEVISLLKYNRGIEKVIKFFEYLENKYINNMKRTIKRLNEGIMTDTEKKGKLTIDQLIEKNEKALKEKTKRIMKSRE